MSKEQMSPILASIEAMIEREAERRLNEHIRSGRFRVTVERVSEDDRFSEVISRFEGTDYRQEYNMSLDSHHRGTVGNHVMWELSNVRYLKLGPVKE